jgi:hypothetical protein
MSESFKVAVIARDHALEAKWSAELQRCVQALRASGAASASEAQIVMFDHSLSDLSQRLEALDRRGKAVFVIVDDEKVGTPKALFSEKVDDALVYPFRPLEVLSKLKHYQQILMWDEVARLNASFSQVLERLHEDLQVVERLQKGRLPARFPEVKGFNVASRYLAGMRSGGDHFDLAESADKQTFSIVLSDSSSYGLSSALLSVLMNVTLKLSVDSLRSAADVVTGVRESLVRVLGEKDRLSLFFGTLSRKDYRLKYLNLGSSRAYYSGPGKRFFALETQENPISQASIGEILRPQELVLEPGGRLVILSDGFVDVANMTQLPTLLDGFRSKEPVDTLNELAFLVKSKFAEPDDMPEQDCSALILDVDTKIIRLA